MNLADSVGWTLVHSVWEIAAISLMLFVSGLAFRGTTSNVRYTAALIALFACLIAPVVTYVVLVPSGAKGDPITPLSVVAQASQTPAVASVQNSPSLMGQTPTVERLGKQIDPVLPSVVFLWLVGLAFMSLRLLGGLIVVERIKRAASSHVDTGTRERTATLARRLGIRRTICLRVSANVSTPAVVGFLRTVILLPASAVAKLSPSDLEALLAHELAHVRRYDYVVNFAQSLVETALFYHPGVWWISSVVRTEREHCCDDIALSVLEDREQYARALLSLEQLRSSSPRLAMAANGGALLARIRRIVLPQAGRAIPGSTWAVLAIAIGITVGLAGTLHAKQGPARKVGAKHKVEIPFDGRVVDERGRPLAGVTVLAEGFDFATRKQGPLVEVVSDSKGEFHLERASNIVGLKSGALMGLAYWKAPMKVTLTMMPVKAIRIRAVDILGRPVAGAVIGPEALGTESNYQRIREGSQIFKRFACTTDSSGRATLENIPSKASVFLAVEDEHLAIRRNTARIQAHRNDDEVTVVLELASTVSGTVTSGGKPAPHSYVFAYSTNEVAPSFTPTDENGRFVLKHQPLGRLVLVGQTRHDFAHNWSDAEAHVDVPIARGTNDSGTDDVELKAGSGSPLKVRVVSPAGRPLGGLDVRVHLSGMEGMAPAGGTTDSNGEFECRAYPGPHKVVVDQWTEELTQTVDVRPGASNLVTIHAPIDEKDARVVCRLIDARGKQLGATTVTIECTDFHGKRIKLRYVTDQFGKAIVSIPESRVKTMSASARSGNEVSDPRIRPHNGVIEIRLHRP